MKIRFRLLLSVISFILFTVSACGSLAVETPEPQHTQSSEKATVTEATTIAEPIDLEKEKKISVIFSHDGAPDDIAAMLYISQHPQIEVIGVVMSYGEQHPSKASEEWGVFLDKVLGMGSVPLSVGSEDPLDQAYIEFPQDWRNGADQFWYLQLPRSPVSIDRREGYQLIIDLINEQEGKITMLVTGAQTDMALALQNQPQIKDKIERIIIMGGAFHVKGNIDGNAGEDSNEAAEWNIFVDALAAKQVFNSGVPLTIIPLDGSDNFRITRAMYDQIKDSKEPGVVLLAQLWEEQFGWWGGDFLLWDILAATAVVHPELFIWECGELDVLTKPGKQYGQTIIVGEGNETECFAVAYDRNALVTDIVKTYLQ